MRHHSVTVGILSDSHGYLDPRIKEKVNGCDYIIHAGDISNAGILEQLQATKELIAVTGNNDYPDIWKAEEIDVLSILPDTAILSLPGGKVYIEHGHKLGNHPEHAKLRKVHKEARLIVYGHTHHRVIDQSASPWVVNPGASGKTRTHGGPSCLILTASNTEWLINEVVFADSVAA